MKASRKYWQRWAETLRRYQLHELTALLLEAGRPLALLGAQALYFGRGFIDNDQLTALAATLEEDNEIREMRLSLGATQVSTGFGKTSAIHAPSAVDQVRGRVVFAAKPLPVIVIGVFSGPCTGETSSTAIFASPAVNAAALTPVNGRAGTPGSPFGANKVTGPVVVSAA